MLEVLTLTTGSHARSLCNPRKLLGGWTALGLLSSIFFLLVLGFVLTMTILMSTTRLTTAMDCRASSDLCSALYVSAKTTMLLIMLERAYAVRMAALGCATGHNAHRRKLRFTNREDFIFMALGVLVILAASVVILLAIDRRQLYGFLITGGDTPDESTKMVCRYTYGKAFVIIVLCGEMICTVVLSLMFFLLLRPLGLRMSCIWSEVMQVPAMTAACRRALHKLRRGSRNNSAADENASSSSTAGMTYAHSSGSPRSLDGTHDAEAEKGLGIIIEQVTMTIQDHRQPVLRLARKCLLGTILMMLPTIANVTTMIAYGHSEQPWICLMLCTLDLTWTLCVVHWLLDTHSSDGTKRKAADDLDGIAVTKPDRISDRI